MSPPKIFFPVIVTVIIIVITLMSPIYMSDRQTNYEVHIQGIVFPKCLISPA